MHSRNEANPTAPTMDDTSNSNTAPLLQRLRQMWQFANLCQWIYIFGKAAKIDDSLDIEELEHECRKPTSTILADIGLALLKLVSPHRGLTLDIFNEQLRKQYLAKAPEINPLGDGETTSQTFQDLDVFSKITVLQQLTQWIMIYPERLREKMDEQKDVDQISWRIEPYGWDADDRTYYVLDDNRVYRVSKPAAPLVAKPKPRPKRTYGSSRRSSKRHHDTADAVGDSGTTFDGDNETILQGSEYGGQRWECVAVTLDDVRHLIRNMQKTRDGNEKILRVQLEVHLLPILERQEESRKRKQDKHEREMLNLAKMASAKRSSRIAHKAELQKQDKMDKEENEKLLREVEEERQAERKRLKVERERDFRMFSRDKRLKEREHRRRLHQEELSQLSEDGKIGPDGTTRVSERRLQLEIERSKQALKDLEGEEEDWIFDCVCGLYGQVDDGAHSIACERCNVWQHSNCINVDKVEADRADFHFICTSCKRRAEETNTPRKTIKLRIKGPTEIAADKQRSTQSKDRSPSPTAVTKTARTVHPEISTKDDIRILARETAIPMATSRSPKTSNTIVNSQRNYNTAAGAPDSGSSGSALRDIQPATVAPVVSETPACVPLNTPLQPAENRTDASKVTDSQGGGHLLASLQATVQSRTSTERNRLELGASPTQSASGISRIPNSSPKSQDILPRGLYTNHSGQPPCTSEGMLIHTLQSGHAEAAEKDTDRSPGMAAPSSFA